MTSWFASMTICRWWATASSSVGSPTAARRSSVRSHKLSPGSTVTTAASTHDAGSGAGISGAASGSAAGIDSSQPARRPLGESRRWPSGCCRSRLSSNSSRQRAASPRWVRASPMSVSPGPTVTRRRSHVGGGSAAVGAATGATVPRPERRPASPGAPTATGPAPRRCSAPPWPTAGGARAWRPRAAGRTTPIPCARLRRRDRRRGPWVGSPAGQPQLGHLQAHLDARARRRSGPTAATPARPARRRPPPPRHDLEPGPSRPRVADEERPARSGRRRPGRRRPSSAPTAPAGPRRLRLMAPRSRCAHPRTGADVDASDTEPARAAAGSRRRPRRRR